MSFMTSFRNWSIFNPRYIKKIIYQTNFYKFFLCFYNPLYNAPVLLLRLPAKRAVSKNYSHYTQILHQVFCQDYIFIGTPQLFVKNMSSR